MKKRCEICLDFTSNQIKASCGHLSFICPTCVEQCKDGIENEKCGKCENKGEAFLCGREAGFQ